MLEVDNVTKIFYDQKRGRGLIALKNVDFIITRSEFVCLIGPSGCGKTTLLNIIAGFERPTLGEVRHEGEVINSPSPKRAVIFQDHSLFPWMTVIENIEFGLRSRGITGKRAHREALHYLEMVGLTEFADARPTQISGGMKQKVAVARALALDPDMLLMDEPFSSLDELTRKRMDLELLELWKRERKTVLFITHNIEEAMLLGDRILLMSALPGRIIKEWKVNGARPRDLLSPGLRALREEIGTELERAHNITGILPVERASAIAACEGNASTLLSRRMESRDMPDMNVIGKDRMLKK